MASGAGEVVDAGAVGLSPGWYVGYPSAAGWYWWIAEMCEFSRVFGATRYATESAAREALAGVNYWQTASRVARVV